jgi:Na+-transporting NADH:ubiquinone oxidoreductase subunit E
MLVEKFAPALYGALGIFLPLIAVNCSILGGALFMQERQFSTILDATAFSLGSGIGWFIAIVAIAAIREKLRYSNVPGPLRGLGITFIVTGLMGIAFMSFMGIKYGKEVVEEEPATEVTTATTNQQLENK